jgi:hypothetical protein
MPQPGKELSEVCIQDSPGDDPEFRLPTRTSAGVFFAKSLLLQLKRGVLNIRQSIHRHPPINDERFPVVLAESVTPLRTNLGEAEVWYQRGKIQNLRVAAQHLDGCAVPAGELFSFWKQVGKPGTSRGYVRGRMLQEGCLIPSVGGGLCQLSNALYQVALNAGFEIVERHAHSRVVPGSATEAGKDATVAWNYIDLRFHSSQDFQLNVGLTTTHLKVSLRARSTPSSSSPRPTEAKAVRRPMLPILNDHACESCGKVECFRSDVHHKIQTGPTVQETVTAYLLDAAWPEFTKYVRSRRNRFDVLAIPLDGSRWNRAQYAWPTEGFAKVHAATLSTLLQSIRSRRLAVQGAARQATLMYRARTLAARLADSLSPDVDEVVVSQSLLPFLWRSGALGGRRIRVLAHQMPASAIQAELDRAWRLHPESNTLNDFRADPWIVDAEDEAFAEAAEVITPHAFVAAHFMGKASLLPWEVPEARLRPPQAKVGDRRTILFPSATLGRKGAYELRDALRGQDVRILLGGSVLEGARFWDGLDVMFSDRSLEGADLVVQPSIVESQPRKLLSAMAVRIPVIATANCGIQSTTASHALPSLDVNALRSAILQALSGID